jgi:hypothetical protein
MIHNATPRISAQQNMMLFFIGIQSNAEQKIKVWLQVVFHIE